MADNDLCRVETPLLVSVRTQSYDEKREIKGTNPQMAFNVLNVRFLTCCAACTILQLRQILCNLRRQNKNKFTVMGSKQPLVQSQP